MNAIIPDQTIEVPVQLKSFIEIKKITGQVYSFSVRRYTVAQTLVSPLPADESIRYELSSFQEADCDGGVPRSDCGEIEVLLKGTE